MKAMLDEADSFGVDLSEPPKFNYEKCPGKIVPIYYKNVHGRTYEYKKNNMFKKDFIYHLDYLGVDFSTYSFSKSIKCGISYIK